MKKYKTLPFQELRQGTLNFTPYSVISEHIWRIQGRGLKNKIAAFKVEDDGTDCAADEIRRRCLSRVTGNSLFVYPKVKTSRDLFRNSGYKIVRDIDKADMVVIPNIRNTITYHYDLLTYDYDNQVLTYYTVNRNIDNREMYRQRFDNDLEMIQEHFRNRRHVLISSRLLDGATLQLLPDLDEYKELLKDDYPKNCIFETNVRVEPPYDINVETLQIWSRCRDYELLCRAICASNYYKYPFTLCLFLQTEKPYIRDYANENLRTVLDWIGFSKDHDIDAIFKGRQIEPYDWNMAQDYIMSLMNVPDGGKYITYNEWINASDYQRFIRKRIAVSHMKMDAPQTYENLVQMVSN